MKISACTIVKNEEKNIQRWYDNAKQYADEIIVVDTGSTDKTLDILEKLPIQLYHYQWKDDFAAAKNFAIDKATGDWITFLDADEYFSEESLAKIRKVIEKNNIEDNINIISCPKINIDIDTGKEISRFYDIRIFSNASNLRYTGIIHEQLFNANGNLQIKKEKDIVIFHTGYSTSIAKQKAQRNLKLLLEKKYENNDIIPWHYIADCYYGLGEYKKVIESLDKYFNLKEYTVINNECSNWRNYINAMLKLELPKDKILNKVFSAIEKLPEIPDFYAFAGIIYFDEGKYLLAKKYFNMAIDIYNNIELDMAGSSFSADVNVVNNKLLQIKELMKNKLTVSACVIVKNNEEDIKKWLESVEKFSDEIIVIDTGCTDKTIDIIKETDALIYQYQWQDDFAAAKNFAIDKAEGSWIVFMDSDEYIESAIDIKNILGKIIDEKIDAVFSRMINIDADNNNAEINRFLQTRVFRNHRNIYYQGRIHEQLYKNGQDLQQVVCEDIIIYHTGYSQKRYLTKMKRNLRLLQDDVDNNGKNKRHYRYMADCYYALGNYSKAIYFYNKHIASGLQSIGNENDVYYNLIEAMLQENYSLQDILLILDVASKKFIDYPQFLMQYGKVYFYLTDYEKSKTYFEKALFNHKNVVQSSDNFTALIPKIYRYLAKIYLYWVDYNKSMFYIDKLLLSDKYNIENIKCMCQVLKQISWQDALMYINKYYANNLQDYLSLIDGSFWSETQEIFTYYNNKLYEEYGIISEKWRLGNIMMQKNNEFDKLLAQASEKIKMMVVALLMLNKLPEEYHTILPESVWHCLQTYYGKQNLQYEDFSTYMMLLPTIILKTNDNILGTYILLIKDFSVQDKKQAIIGLCNLKKWQQASLLLTEELVKGNIKDNELVLNFAKCNYYMKNWQTAEKYFKEIAKIKEYEAEADSYLTWIEERRAGKW
ncbi:glycosyltransferase family 2 protein [Pectinatus brassicae]|uniref:Glycosyltransferase involved in cell wall biosynthesis n=1 Tax=Pectinatus brassicae TaxID=862415 RepID=A0A840UI98_9FIRM|nr:glycosyltransferase family 2 protein [Pectinatus brassicae]MBB5336836.1 glycosyltransferase involved in cell wall biosynthesis [Pectinatus brassicae]